MVFAFLPLYGMQHGLSEGAAALMVTMGGLGNLLLAIPIGIIADRVDKTLLLAACALLSFAGAVILPLVIGTTPLAYALMFVWGGLTVGLYTVGLTQLGARFSGGGLASANALFIMLYSFGMLVGPAAAGVASDAWTHGLPAVLAALLALQCLVAAARWATRRRKARPA